MKPQIEFSLTIDAVLNFYCFHEDRRIPKLRLKELGLETKNINLFSQIVNILNYLESLPMVPFDHHNIQMLISDLKEIPVADDALKSKLDFLIEQIELAYMHTNHRRYSPELLSICVLWENCSSNLYKQIRDEGVLTLPSVRYIKKLTSALNVDTGLTEQTVKYLKARLEKLTAAERIGSLLMDEVYVAKRCEYSRANGRIYGMDENTPTKTLLTTMFKSIASKYEDVIAMIPLTKIDSAKINNLFMKCLETITPLGYNIVSTLVDGHSSNVKFYKNEFCDGEIKPYIENPLDNTKKIFHSFDSTHIFKCIYNNFKAKKSFECTPFDGS